MMKRVAPAVLLAALAGAVQAQDEPAPPSSGRRGPTPLQIQLVVARKQAGKAVARLPYTLTCNADDDRRASLRMGVEVPVVVGGGKGIQYRNVGMNIDCQATSLGDGRFRFNIGVEQSSVSEVEPARAQPRSGDQPPAEDAPAAGNPMFRTFNSMFAAILRDGQTVLHTAATDPVSGEEVTIEVTLKALK